MGDWFFYLISNGRSISIEDWTGEAFEGVSMYYNAETLKTQDTNILRGMMGLLNQFGADRVISFVMDLVDEYKYPLRKAVTTLTYKNCFIFSDLDLECFVRDVFRERYSIPFNYEILDWMDLDEFKFCLENAIIEENDKSLLFLPSSDCTLIQAEKCETYGELVKRFAQIQLFPAR